MKEEKMKMLNREILNELNQNFPHFNQLKSDEYITDGISTIMRPNDIYNQNENYFENYNSVQNESEFHCLDRMDYELEYENQILFNNDNSNKQLMLQSKLEKRNARERKRVQQVNLEFQKLRKLLINKSFSDNIKAKNIDDDDSCDASNLQLSFTNPNKRISKVKTLRCAIEYIKYLQNVLRENDNSEMCQQNYCFEMSSLSSSSISNVDISFDENQQKKQKLTNDNYSYNNEHVDYTNYNIQTKSESNKYTNYNCQNYEQIHYSTFNNHLNYYDF